MAILCFIRQRRIGTVNNIAPQGRFKLDDDVSLSDMIRDLQDAKMGDPRRLAYIMERIESDRPIYNSDEQYVREKFRQLREEITQKSDDFERIDAPPPEAPNMTPEPQPSIPRKASKAWYLLPVFLGILGGVVAFAALRKRNRGMAYKNLGLGVGLTMLLVVPIAVLVVLEVGADGLFESEPDVQYTDAEVKRMAVTIPHDSLMNNPEIHEGEIVHYGGEIIQVQPSLFGEYTLRVKIAQDELFKSDVVWVNYTPVSDEEEEWLGMIEGDLDEIFGVDYEVIEVWGISKGLREYSAILGNTITIPEVDAILIERRSQSEQATNSVDPEPQAAPPDQPRASHTMSFSDIPAYVDAPTVERAVIDAVREWDMANPNVDFTLSESDADVNISWARYMPGAALGLHSASVTDDGTRERHSITVRLGIDDCHSEYQPFTHGTLQYIIAHETCHYLGLRHVDDESHLMHSGEFFNVDSARVYDDLNLGIPYLERPEIATDAGLAIQAQIDELDSDLDQVSSQRQELKDAGGNLDDNTIVYNDLVQKIQELEDQLACVNLT